jgi:hypothetical protein
MSSRLDPILLRRYEPDPERELAALRAAFNIKYPQPATVRSPALTLVVAGGSEVSQQCSQAAQKAV